jgi:hypothetical protein
MQVALKVLVFVVVLLLALFAYLYYQSSRSVLYRYVEAGNPVKEPAFAVFNPFRDHSPERSAETFLKIIKDGQCEQAMSAVPGTLEHRQDTCEHEKESPLMAWRLTNRIDQPERVRMYYRVNRKTYDGHQEQLWVTLEKHGENWEVMQYECFY